LIHAGEYNQMPGTPAFVLAVGLWFEGYFDQTALGDVKKDLTADVHLAARPGETFTGRVSNVDPIVSYTTGGPETGTPVRPVGTGGPEWPATFQVRIELAPEVLAGLSSGLTGFAHLVVEHEAVTVPVGAMAPISSGNGLLAIVDSNGWSLRRAHFGALANGWLEVLDGVAPGEKVIVQGHDVLRAGDRLRESSWKPPKGGS
jgi:multidrug efflux pump subunit AcrA (membrane-fusion protein)